MKKVLFIANHREGRSPGQRFRFEQYIAYLSQNGFDCEISFLISEKDDKIFYSSGNFVRKMIILLKSYCIRYRDIRRVNTFDIIFIFREAMMTGSWIFEKYFSKSKTKVIYDFDDAIWLANVSEGNKKFEWLKNYNKVSEIIKISDYVIAGNKFLHNYAQYYNKNVIVIPTTIDTSYHTHNKKAYSIQINIGWTGTETTIKHFEIAIPILKQLKSKYKDKINFLLISNKPSDCKDIEIEYIPWNKETEIEDLAKIDIGIMPLSDDKWAKGKCGFKGLQYMSLGIPTIMSPVGVNCEIIEDGVNGYLAHSDEEWIEKISQLIESSELREKLGKKGKETIEQRYSVESQKNVYLELFREVAGK